MIKLILVYSWWNSMPPLHENDNYIAKWKMPELSCNVKQKKKKDSKFCEKLKWMKAERKYSKKKSVVGEWQNCVFNFFKTMTWFHYLYILNCPKPRCAKNNHHNYINSWSFLHFLCVYFQTNVCISDKYIL